MFIGSPAVYLTFKGPLMTFKVELGRISNDGTQDGIFINFFFKETSKLRRLMDFSYGNQNFFSKSNVGSKKYFRCAENKQNSISAGSTVISKRRLCTTNRLTLCKTLQMTQTNLFASKIIAALENFRFSHQVVDLSFVKQIEITAHILHSECQCWFQIKYQKTLLIAEISINLK